MTDFHPLKVIEVRRETDDAVSVLLEVPTELEKEFSYIPGQYITFRKSVNNEELRRSYSICTAPFQKQLRVGIKQIPEGRFSTFANNVLKAGDTLDTFPPGGRFQYGSNATEGKHIVGLAGGSGITPILSILKEVLHEEPDSHFTLFYGNRNSNSIIFKEEISALKNRYMGRLTVHHVLSDEDVGSDIFQGMMTREKVKELTGKLITTQDVDHLYICGPEPMIIGAKEVLKETGVPDDRVHFELFGTATTDSKTAQAKPVSKGPKVESNLKIILDADEFELNLNSDGQSILDAATEAGIDVPFSCKGAVCCTCLARVKEGEVSMDKNYSLSDKEVADGLILTCQGHPRSKKVIIDFDDIW